MPNTYPIKDINRPFTMWLKGELWVPNGTVEQVFLPNVNDAVVEWGVGTYRVTAVNYTDNTYVLLKSPIDPPSTGLLDTDVLLGSGPGQTSESFRVYMNTETTPITVDFDTRLSIKSAQANKIRLFRGEDITEATGHVISKQGPGVGTNDFYLLDLLVMPGLNNLAVKTPKRGYAIEPLQDGDVVTAVVYSADDRVLSHSRLLVVNTNFIRTTNVSIKYITSIQLLSNYLVGGGNGDTLEYPLNIPIQSDNLRGRVNYSDGSHIVLPVDGTKFQLHGMNNYIASVLGQTVDLVLQYNMSANEYAFNVEQPAPRYISRPYKVTTIQRDGIYSVKLFIVPRWITSHPTLPVPRWTLDYYLENTERNVIYNVTQHVAKTTESAEFNGQSIGVRQELTMAINLQNIAGGGYNYFRHVQKFWITLGSNGSNAAANGYWTIEYTDGNVFGYHLEAEATGSVGGPWSIDVSNGITGGTLLDVRPFINWLNALYYKAEPLYIPHAEAQPLEPTHFRVVVGSGLTTFTREIEIVDYGDLIENVTTEPVQGQPVRLEFFRRTVSGDLELAVSSLTVKRV